jgi:hypothetical protein
LIPPSGCKVWWDRGPLLFRKSDLSDVVLVMTGSGLLSLPKFASSRSGGARRFSLAVSVTL